MRKLLPLFCALCALPALSRSVNDGVYTKQQAERGQALFAEHCAGCHGETLAGVEGPELAGAGFTGRWKGNNAGALFSFILKTMPPEDPGTLTPKQSADLTAFILSANKFPAGERELADSVTELKEISFPPKP